MLKLEIIREQSDGVCQSGK